MTEAQLQRLIFEHVRARGARRTFLFHPMNGGTHQIGRRAGINSAMGVVSGVPDLIGVREGASSRSNSKPKTAGCRTRNKTCSFGCVRPARPRRTHTGWTKRCKSSNAGNCSEGVRNDQAPRHRRSAQARGL